MSSNAILQKFVWSGEMLLSVTDASSNTAYYCFHDGNKNTSELLDASGTIAAHYEYSPFGKALVSTGTYASANPFRFSGEFADDETGLVYYNFRYYSPDLGRWLSKDPIEEEGGWNLYCMVRNNPVTLWDENGQWGAVAVVAVVAIAVYVVTPALVIGQQAHYDRNILNNPPETENDASKKGWKPLTPEKSIYHRQGKGGEGNTKYVSPDGTQEGVYNKDGKLVNDPVNQGTYNMDDPNSNPIGHFVNDMVPYYMWGNSPDDPTSAWDRIFGTYEGDIPGENSVGCPCAK